MVTGPKCFRGFRELNKPQVLYKVLNFWLDHKYCRGNHRFLSKWDKGFGKWAAHPQSMFVGVTPAIYLNRPTNDVTKHNFLRRRWWYCYIFGQFWVLTKLAHLVIWLERSRVLVLLWQHAKFSTRKVCASLLFHWRKFVYTFFQKISPCCLTKGKKFFWISSLRTRQQGLICKKTKEYWNGGHFGIRCITAR